MVILLVFFKENWCVT